MTFAKKKICVIWHWFSQRFKSSNFHFRNESTFTAWKRQPWWILRWRKGRGFQLPVDSRIRHTKRSDLQAVNCSLACRACPSNGPGFAHPSMATTGWMLVEGHRCSFANFTLLLGQFDRLAFGLLFRQSFRHWHIYTALLSFNLVYCRLPFVARERKCTFQLSLSVGH